MKQLPILSLSILLLEGLGFPQEDNQTTLHATVGAAIQGRTTHEQLFRPTDFTSLQDYVKANFEDRYNLSTLQTGTASDGKPQITFWSVENGMLTDTTIVDTGTLLESTTHTSPAFGNPADFASEPNQKSHESVLLEASKLIAQATVQNPSCGGLTSVPANKCSCCTGGGTSGNCTFAAWELARQAWGYQLPMWGNAGTWYGSAQKTSIPTSPSVALFSIAVSSSLSSYGHVAFVTAVNTVNGQRKITVSEEQCVSPTPEPYTIGKTWSTSSFMGYILNPAVNYQSIPILGSLSATPTSNSGYDQYLSFAVSNVQTGMKAVVIFPSGYTGTLEPSAGQVGSYAYSGYGVVWTRIRLSEKGNYSIQFFNPNGVFSRLFNFQVR